MEAVKAVLIHLVVPAAGLQRLLRPHEEMREEGVQRPPVIPLFIIFATHGGLLLLVALAALFRYWSGMASPGPAYLLFPAPAAVPALARRLYPRRKLPRFHMAAFVASVSSVGALACCVAFTTARRRLVRGA